MKRIIMGTLLMLILVSIAKEPVITAASFFQHGPTLLNVGVGYAFESISNYGGGSPVVTFGVNSYSWLTLMMMGVMFASISGTSMLFTYNIHRYYLAREIHCVDLYPYLKISWMSLMIVILILLFAFIFVYSLWFVVITILVAKALGYYLYTRLNRKQGHPFQIRVLQKAYVTSTVFVALLVMFFI